MCTPDNGAPFFFHGSIKDRRRDSMEHFVAHCRIDWNELRKEGWRIVRVRLTTELHQ